MHVPDPLLNDVHSQLNLTRVARVERPMTLAELQAIVVSARQNQQHISIAGGRHARSEPQANLPLAIQLFLRIKMYANSH